MNKKNNFNYFSSSHRFIFETMNHSQSSSLYWNLFIMHNNKEFCPLPRLKFTFKLWINHPCTEVTWCFIFLTQQNHLCYSCYSETVILRRFDIALISTIKELLYIEKLKLPNLPKIDQAFELFLMVEMFLHGLYFILNACSDDLQHWQMKWNIGYKWAVKTLAIERD